MSSLITLNDYNIYNNISTIIPINNKYNYNNNYTLFTLDAISDTKNYQDEFVLTKLYPENDNDKIKSLKAKNRKESILKCIKEGHANQRLFIEKVKNCKDRSLIIKRFQLGCNHRYCPNCNNKYRTKSYFRIRDSVKTMKNPRFMTVGFKNLFELKKTKLQLFSKQFNRYCQYLRRKGYSLGNYINVMEIKLNKKRDPLYRSFKNRYGQWKKKLVGSYSRDSWNVHYHIIYDGTFIPINQAKECFKKVTKGVSYHIDIRYIQKDVIHSHEKSAGYVTKYITKMCFKSADFSDIITFYKQTTKIKFVKYSGFKTPKKEVIYISFYQYIKYVGKMDKLDSFQMYCEYLANMNQFSLNQYDFNQTIEENVIQYADDNILLEKIHGVI